MFLRRESVLEAGNVLKVGKCSEVCKFSGGGKVLKHLLSFEAGKFS